MSQRTLDEWADHWLDRMKAKPRERLDMTKHRQVFTERDLLASFVAGFFHAYSIAKREEREQDDSRAGL